MIYRPRCRGTRVPQEGTLTIRTELVARLALCVQGHPKMTVCVTAEVYGLSDAETRELHRMVYTPLGRPRLQGATR